MWTLFVQQQVISFVVVVEHRLTKSCLAITTQIHFIKSKLPKKPLIKKKKTACINLYILRRTGWINSILKSNFGSSDTHGKRNLEVPELDENSRAFWNLQWGKDYEHLLQETVLLSLWFKINIITKFHIEFPIQSNS